MTRQSARDSVDSDVRWPRASHEDGMSTANDALRARIGAVRAMAPKIQLIANAAAAPRMADVALAVGARPIMGCTTVEETVEVRGKTDGCVLNFGTPTTEAIAEAVEVDEINLGAGNGGRVERVLVMDPVGCGLESRGRRARKWIEGLRARARVGGVDGVDAGRGRVFGYVIKGNPSEIEALLRLTVDSPEMKTKTTTTTTRVSVGASVSCTAESSVVDGHGVGTGEKKAGHIFDALQRLCEVTGCLAVVMTGKTDYVYTFRGERWSSDENSCEALEKWTGAGCALGVVVAAFIAANGDDLFSALQAACQWYRRVARRCADEFPELGPFSFQARFFDELYRESCAYGSQV